MSKLLDSPTFVAVFKDGTVTRLTAYCPKGLDYDRAMRVAGVAWLSRNKHSTDSRNDHLVPPIVGCHFERDGKRID